MAEGIVRAGGLSRAVAESLLSTRSIPAAEAPKSVLCPRPRHLPSFSRGLSSESLSEEDVVVPRATSPRDDSDLDASVAELRRILEVDCTLDADPGCSFLGVSPPLRSGAHNPLAHDSQWKLKAHQASRTSLEALQRAGGLDRGSAQMTCCRGDFRVLFSPPDCSGGGGGALLAAAYDPSSTQQGVPHGRARLAVPSWRSGGLSPDARIFS